MTVWLNGTLMPAEAAHIDPSDRGFTLGDGLFETIRVQHGKAAHLALHLARLRNGAAVLGIPIERTDDVIGEAIAAVVEAAGLASAAMRVTLTRGPALRGVLPPSDPRPTMLITAGALPPPLPPARAIIATATRRNQASPLSRIKSLNYLDGIIARREAATRGVDDAILLDTRGRLAESTAANLFVVMNETIVTPPVADGALPGITRDRLLTAGIAQERTLMPEHLHEASAAFLANSLGLRALACIDDRKFDTDHPAWRAVCRWWDTNT
jgi:branched-chain amino acid aminotransferase